MEQEIQTNETEVKEKDNSKKIFIARVIGFCLFGCILPFIFIAWRYDIFRVHNEISPRVSLTGWGFVAVLIVFFFIRYCMGVLKRAIPFSLTYQIINGFIKVLMPLILFYIVITAIANSIDLFKQALLITIICEAVAIVINPFPKFMHDKGIEHAEGIMDLFIKKWKEKDKQ